MPRLKRTFALVAALCGAAAVAVGAPASSAAQRSVARCHGGYYKNVSGQCVHRPVRAAKAPLGATAKCRDGSYSFSEHASGTCSHHGGVGRWIHHP